MLIGLGLAALGATAGAAVLTGLLSQITELPVASGLLGALIGGLGIGIGLFIALIGLIMLLINWKFLHGSYLAWAIVLALNVLSLLGSLPNLLSGLRVPFLLFVSLLPFLFNVIVIIYLIQPRVRAYFEGKPKEPLLLPPPPPTI